MSSSSMPATETVKQGRGVSLAAGVLAVLVAAGPMETVTERSLTAHMVQHLLLFAVAPPLLVVGAPVRLRSFVPRDARWMWWSGAGVAIQAGVMVVWHLPGPFALALDHAPVHAIEHLSLLASGLFFWWTIIGAGRSARYGVAVIAVFISSLPSIGVGAAWTLANHPWRPRYTLSDQQLAGVFMWSFGGMVGLVAALALFRSWMTNMEPLR